MKTVFIKTHQYKGFNFNLTRDNIESFILKNKLIKNLKFYRIHCFNNLLNLLINDTYTNTEFKKLIRFSISEQKKLGNREVRYWLIRGYSRKQAKNEISNVQSKNNEKRFIKYTKEEIRLQNLKCHIGKTKQDYRNSSVRCMEFWLLKGCTYNQAKKEIKRVCDTSLKKMINKYGEINGTKRYKSMIKKKSNKSKGKNNSMFGKPSPMGTGNGFSGWYKKYYVRSLFEYFAIKDLEQKNKNFIINIGNNKLLKIKITEDKNYYPDILLPDEQKIVEIKPNFNLNSDDTILKKKTTERLLKLGKIKNYKYYEIWTEDVLNFDYELLKVDYNDKVFKIDKSKKERFEIYLTNENYKKN